MPHKKKIFNIAETFVGCGGSHFGFKKAGFKTLFVNDIWEDAINTLKMNEPGLPHDKIICDDISTLTADRLDGMGVDRTDVDVLLGGVVCKGFSLAGIRNPFDERNYLYLEQLRLVELLRPKISIIENVPGIMSMKILNRDIPGIKTTCEQLDNLCERQKKKNGYLISMKKKYGADLTTAGIKQELDDIIVERKEVEKSLDVHMYSVIGDIEKRYIKLGYEVHRKVLCCDDYGCATSRRRLFIVAVRKDSGIEWEYPEPTTPDLPPTVRDAFAKLDYNGINNPDFDDDNRPMCHRKETVEKFMSIGTEKDPEKPQGYFSRGSSSRLDYDKPAPTLVPGHSSFQIHPVEHRSITVREGAIITGFDRTFKFYGNHSSRCMQIGNAIPMNMAYQIAKQCQKVLS